MALAELDLTGGSGFLDVACGTGWAVRAARSHVPDGPVAGIDVSPGMIGVAAKDAPETVEFKLAKASEIPYLDETFHSVLCSCAFHHFPRPMRALEEIRRVLAPDGTFVLLDAARDVSLGIWLQDRWRRLLEASHIRYYTTRELRRFVKAAGMQLDGETRTIKKFRDRGKMFTGLAVLTCRRG